MDVIAYNPASMHTTVVDTDSGRSQPPDCATTVTLRRSRPGGAATRDGIPHTAEVCAFAAAFAARLVALTFTRESGSTTSATDRWLPGSP
jgi:hypothetical protein